MTFLLFAFHGYPKHIFTSLQIILFTISYIIIISNKSVTCYVRQPSRSGLGLGPVKKQVILLFILGNFYICTAQPVRPSR